MLETDEVIQMWYKLAAGENVNTDDVFFRFVAVWVAFNAYYNFHYGDEQSSNGRPIGDKAQVKRFAEMYLAKTTHKELMLTDSDYQKAVLYLKSRGVRDTHTQRVARILNEQDLQSVIVCVYQVRCNLFHGGKRPNNTRDIELVSASYTVVSKIFRPFVNFTN